jgi:hypothetical protein
MQRVGDPQWFRQPTKAAHTQSRRHRVNLLSTDDGRRADPHVSSDVHHRTLLAGSPELHRDTLRTMVCNQPPTFAGSRS